MKLHEPTSVIVIVPALPCKYTLQTIGPTNLYIFIVEQHLYFQYLFNLDGLHDFIFFVDTFFFSSSRLTYNNRIKILKCYTVKENIHCYYIINTMFLNVYAIFFIYIFNDYSVYHIFLFSLKQFYFKTLKFANK